MAYLIDTVAVNSRTDWRATQVPGPLQARSEETIPGLEIRFVNSGPELGLDLIIEGFLEGSSTTVDLAIAALYANIAYDSALRITMEHVVSIHGVTFNSMELLTVQPLGKIQGVAAATGTFKVIQPIRHHWRKLL